MTISNLTSAAFLICFLISNEPFGSTAFSIKLIPIDRFDTTLFPKNLTLKERFRRIFEISRTRVHQLEFAASLSSRGRKVSVDNGPNTLQPKIALHASNYYITTMRVGTPPFTISLVVSTGSDDTWTQCRGCTHCFPTRQVNFDRYASRTYRHLASNDPLCSPRITVNGNCTYKARCFSHGMFNCYSKGVVGLDTFVFSDGIRSVREFPNTVFGCGLDNYNIPWATGGQNYSVSGILGLGLGPRSIFSQYGNETKGRLSYCLPSMYSQTGTYTLLKFGDDASIDGPSGAVIQRTSLVPNATQYAVTVMGISVCGKRLNINPACFRIRPDRTGGFVFDTGLPYTILARTAFTAVKAELIKYFTDNYGWHPRTRQPGRFDLCYDLPHGNYTFPFMTIHFEGADLLLDGNHLFLFSIGGFCLVMKPGSGSGINIFGAFQQANYHFLFDFRSHTLSFVSKVCQFHQELNAEEKGIAS